MNWIDAHAHLTDPRFADHLDALLRQSAEAGITRFVLGGTEPTEWEQQKALAARFPRKIYPSFGLHPWWVAKASSMQIQEGLIHLREELARKNRICVAIGETGLDYHPKLRETSYEVQAKTFRAHLRLALEFKTPLVLHVVHAHPAALKILREEAGKVLLVRKPYQGIVHSFSGDLSVAKAYLDLGFTLSISAAVITRGKGSGYVVLNQTLAELGPKDFVIETDSPDQPPEGESGPNEPRNLLRIAELIGEVRDETVQDIMNRSRDRIIQLFGLPPV